MAHSQTASAHLEAEPSQPALDAPPALPRHARVIAVGASAGGLHALSLILAALPADLPAPVLVVQHLAPDFPSRLAHILGRHTDLRVRQAAEGDRLHAGWVYVAPPDRHLLARADGTLSLTQTHKVHHCRPSADVLLASVAASFGTRAVGVILTGGDGDGAAGITAIKEAGGVTLAQDVPSSQEASMPRHAAATGAVDFVLPLTEIAAALVALTGPVGRFDPERDGHPRGRTVVGGNGKVGGNGAQGGHSDRDRVVERVRARRGLVAGLLARATPNASGLLAEAVGELAACAEALGVAEEALRVQSDVITSYRLALQDEAAGLPAR